MDARLQHGGDRPARPAQTADIPGRHPGQPADPPLDLFRTPADEFDGFDSPAAPRSAGPLRWRIATVPGGESAGHGFEPLTGPLVRVGHDQGFRRRIPKPGRIPVGIGQSSHGMPGDDRAKLSVAPAGQPDRGAVAVTGAIHLGPNGRQLVHVMQECRRLREAAIDRMPGLPGTQGQPGRGLGHGARMTQVPVGWIE